MCIHCGRVCEFGEVCEACRRKLGKHHRGSFTHATRREGLHEDGNYRSKYHRAEQRLCKIALVGDLQFSEDEWDALCTREAGRIGNYK